MRYKRFVLGFVLSLMTMMMAGNLQSNKTIQGYPINILIETTADWTDLQFNNTDFHYLGDTILTQNPVLMGILSLHKTAYDSTLTRAEFRIMFTQKLPKAVKFSIRKGGIGQTKIIFLTPKQETIAEYVNTKNIPGDVQNQENFILSRKEIEKHYNIKQPILHYLGQNSLTLQTEKLVLAFYFPWYYPENWSWPGKLAIAHQPRLGLYSSSDPEIVKTHIDWAKKAGIDGFICSWWGINSVTDQNLKLIANLCQERDFKFTVYVEQVKNTADLKKSMGYLDSVYAEHTNIIKLGNKPVIFIYNRVLDSIPLESLRLEKFDFATINYGYKISNLQGFEGYHEFLPPYQNGDKNEKFYRLARQVADSKGKIFAAPVMPGFNNCSLVTPGTLIDRNKGKYYKKLWDAVIAAQPDWVLITSFNEWFEGTEIEPSLEFGDYYLNLTRQYAQKFKSK
ncbi:MAG: hypothetical protein KGZ86_03810 [Candidatus Latescibacteria bacterium]|nr:hypothetical protein [Candidatus Latescibacterota bacterium]